MDRESCASDWGSARAVVQPEATRTVPTDFLPADVSCAWCDAAKSLSLGWAEMGAARLYVCSCCTKQTTVVDGVATRALSPVPSTDIRGLPIDEDS